MMTPDTHHPPTPRGLPLRSNRASDPPEAIRQWLATAHPDPRRAYAEWTDHGIALLPLGRRFNAIRIPGILLHTAAGNDEPQHVAQTAYDLLDGPVIHDHLSIGPTYYALVPYGRDTHWPDDNDTPLLRDGTYLGVPDLHHIAQPRTHWITAPRYRNDLCRHDAVLDFILTAPTHTWHRVSPRQQLTDPQSLTVPQTTVGDVSRAGPTPE